MRSVIFDSLAFFVAMLVLHLTCIGLFTWGFFLTKYQVTNVSECSTAPPFLRESARNEPLSSPDSGGGCWMPSRFRKVIIIVVDALRFDFVLADSVPPEEQNPNFHGHLPAVGRLLREQPQHAKLYRFAADPPTVTMQRLKGLTTGGLPTFLEVSTNFDSFAIWEDNLVHQLVNHNRTVVFMGDDTWENLFPSAFARSYPFPSFNVKDLHTVDNGVLFHLMPEILRNQQATSDGREAVDGGKWDVLIAHFLGVDHVGHRYGPDHPEMASKLTQMNDMLEEVVSNMDEDTILVFMGDHGMTPEGNHGGATPYETGSALFFYSKSPILRTDLPHRRDPFPSIMEGVREVEQIDLVPTLALLIGVPVPFGSLGFPVPELFSELPMQGRASGPDLVEMYGLAQGGPKDALTAERCRDILLRLSRVNEAFLATAAQLSHYTRTYASVSTEFSQEVLDDLEAPLRVAAAVYDKVRGNMWTSLLAEPENETKSLLMRLRSLTVEQRRTLLLEHIKIYHHLDQYQNSVLLTCKRLWTTFDLPLMQWAVLLLLLVVGGLQVPALVFLRSHLPPPRSVLFVGLKTATVVGAIAALAAPILRGVLFDENAPVVLIVVAVAALGFQLRVVMLSLFSGPERPPDSLEDETTKESREPVWDFVGWLNRVVGDPSSLGPMNAPAVLAVGLILLHGAGLFSNSFLEAQAPALLFLGQTIVLGTGLYAVRLGMGRGAFQTILIAAVSRVSKEAAENVNRAGEVVLPSFMDVELIYRVALPLFLIAGVWGWWLRKTHRSIFSRPTADYPLELTGFGRVLLFMILPFELLCVMGFWTLQTQSGADTVYRSMSLIFPWGVYMSVVAVVARLLWHPVLVRCKDSPQTPLSMAHTAAHFALTMSILAAVFLGAVCLVLGVRAAWVVACLSVQLLLWLDFSRSMQLRVFLLSSQSLADGARAGTPQDQRARLLPVRVADCCVWGFFTLWYFYASGHVCSFGALHIEAAFVGFEKFYFLPGGFLLLLDTYGPGHGMCLLLLPVLVAVASRTSATRRAAARAHGEGVEFVRRVAQALAGYQFLFSFQFACTVVFVYFARRHLMVWRLFAPQYIFDMTQLIVVDVLSVLVLALTMRWGSYAFVDTTTA